MTKRPPHLIEPALSPNAYTVLERRYLAKTDDGQTSETPADLFWRVARFVAQGDTSYGKNEAEVQALAETFYTLLCDLRFLPNSPTLMNAARPLGQLSACFVLPIEDSLESIFTTLKHAAIIHQSGGGTGFSFSHLRPRGDTVRSTSGVSSGPVSFMEVYNAATEAIKQGGTRRGANMGVLRVDHPDIEEFIACKNDLSRITNFNISVLITNTFMQAVEGNRAFPLVHPTTGATVKTVAAKALFDTIVDNAWQTGEPGIIFIDRVNADNPTPALGHIESTNPCGEVPLLAYEACNLGSINLAKFVTQNKMDWNALKETIWQATHFLDNVITQNNFPLPEIKTMVEGNRKIGLGIMGWADLLIALNVPYNSDEAILLAKDVAAFLDYESKCASVALAKQRGNFPNFTQSRYADGTWLSQKHVQHETRQITSAQWQALDEAIKQHGLRNATTSCIAPTGTISIIASCSGGVEPLFSVVYERNVMDGTRMVESHPAFEAAAKSGGFANDDLFRQIASAGTVQHLDAVPKTVKSVFVAAHDITPHWHVRMQGAFQEFTDNAVSKTINFSEQATRADVAEAYWQAYRSGNIKGMTVYRNNSRNYQPMTLKPMAPESRIEEWSSPTCYECD